MDPDEALKNARKALSRLRTLESMRLDTGLSDEPEIGADDARELLSELADAFAALDQWLSAGGFLPRAWRDAARNSTDAARTAQ